MKISYSRRNFLKTAALAAGAGFGLGQAHIFGETVPRAQGSQESEVTISCTAGQRLRVEAIDPSIVRLWFKREGDFTRAQSLATETMPTSRAPLDVLFSMPEAIYASTAQLAIAINPRSLDFTAYPAAMKDVPIIPATNITGPLDAQSWTLRRKLAEGERILGLGQDNHNHGRLDRRGVIRELWAGQQINSGDVTAQYPVPLLIGLLANGYAYGMFFDNVHRLRFDIGATRTDVLSVDADGGEIDVYIIAGPKIADVIERYTRLTGRPSLPPLWALGYWQSKCTYYDWRPLDEAYHQLHSRGFPVDVMVIDYDWPEILNNFQWAKRWYPAGGTPADKIADYAKKDVRIVMSQSTFPVPLAWSTTRERKR
jgi:alpha-glucosidase (family GH31 glycosyl hydrolase)